jgi:hypothetical protein
MLVADLAAIADIMLADPKNRRDLTVDRLDRRRWQTIVMIASPSIFDGQILAVGRAGLPAPKGIRRPM